MKPGTQCRVAGWGKFHNKSPVSDVLREVNITVIDRKICNDQKHYNYNPMIGVNMICAGSFKGGRDSCNVSKISSTFSCWIESRRYRKCNVMLCLVMLASKGLRGAFSKEA